MAGSETNDNTPVNDKAAAPAESAVTAHFDAPSLQTPSTDKLTDASDKGLTPVGDLSSFMSTDKWRGADNEATKANADAMQKQMPFNQKALIRSYK